MRYGLKGFAAPNMAGRKQVVNSLVYNFPGGQQTFVVPKTGWWKVVMWGAGGLGGSTGSGNSTGGGSGAYIEAIRHLSARQSVKLDIGSTSGASTRVTFPSGEVLTAGGGLSGSTGASGGLASANTAVGDIAINGSAGGSNADGAGGAGTGGAAGGSGGSGTFGGGAGAPANAPFAGGAGGGSVNSAGQCPGGGGGSTTGSSTVFGSGFVLVCRLRFAM